VSITKAVDALYAVKEAAVSLMSDRTYPWIDRDAVYGSQHKLQNYDICLPRPLEESPVESTVWVLYVA
jgi:hypothetical protein